MTMRIARGMRDDEGAVTIIVVVCLIVFLALAALAVDAGYWYNVRRQLQASADAAALAGCLQLKMDPGSASSVANEYAVANSNGAGHGLGVDSVEVGSDYVQVTVSKEGPIFFGQAAGASDGPNIRATSRAKLAWLRGANKLVPWFLPVFVPDTVRVQLDGGGASQELGGSGSTFSSGWDPGLSAPAPSVSGKKGSQTRTISGRLVDFVATNQYGVEARLDRASSVLVLPGSSPVSDVSVSPHMTGSGGFDLIVDVNGNAAGVPIASVSGGSMSGAWPSSPGASRYTFHGSASSAGGHPISISIAEKPTGSGVTSSTFVINNAAAVAGREAIDPFLDIDIGRTCFSGSSSSSLYTVKMMSIDGFLAGDSYDLKVGEKESVAGNFQGLDLAGNGGSGYSDCIVTGYDGEIFIGQIIDSLPGNKTGPTASGLSERFAVAGGEPSTYDAWVADKPPCGRLVYVPLCEWTSDPSGKSAPVIVRGFAAFFIEGEPGGTATGRFVEYVGTGTPGTGPPPFDKALTTPRLVREGVDF